MKDLMRTSLSLFLLLVLSACNLGGSTPQAITGETSPVRLAVRTHNGASTFSQAGEVINYDYIIANGGTARLAGPATVVDEGRQVSCPDVATVGNLDTFLDPGETLICTSTYTITQADVNTGSVRDYATATVAGIASAPTGVNLNLAAARVLSALILTKAASSQTYGQVGQTITYNYTITNTGTNPLGPAQFVITDNKFGAPLNCGPAATTLAPSQMVTCSFPYMISQADMAVPSLTNSATASGGGQTSAPASATITNLTVAAATQTLNPIQTATLGAPSNLTPGSTIQHQVAVGEWLIQIGRCYGASFEDVRNANPQILDPNLILPSMIVTIPRIGSVGRIYGPPCVTWYVVQSGDTWEAIAARYNADLTVLHLANPVALTPGAKIKIPLNSAGTVRLTPIPVTFTATPTATTTASAQRITFQPGQTTVSLTGFVNPNQTVSYVINTTVGQTLTVNVSTSAVNEVGLGVNGPTGLALKPMDGTLAWTTNITTGGDHYINVASILGSASKTYTLTVSLTSAATATFTPTATSTPTTGTQ